MELDFEAHPQANPDSATSRHEPHLGHFAKRTRRFHRPPSLSEADLLAEALHLLGFDAASVTTQLMNGGDLRFALQSCRVGVDPKAVAEQQPDLERHRLQEAWDVYAASRADVDDPVTTTPGSPLFEAVRLLGFRPHLVCHFLWSRRADAMRLALRNATVALQLDRPRAETSMTLGAFTNATRAFRACRGETSADPARFSLCARTCRF